MSLNKKINVAIIMDGNGRWAKSHNKPRTFGHKKGLETLKHLIKDIINTKMQIDWLSVFAFSTENWQRPKAEVNFLLKLFENSLNKELIGDLNKQNIKFVWTGFKNKLSKKLVDKILVAQKSTKNNSGLKLNIVFNYSGLKDINQFKTTKKLISSNIPNIDLLIRTSGEKRISNFLLCQLAYSEFVFEKTLWPDYTINILKKNIIEYKKRNRRFGKI